MAKQNNAPDEAPSGSGLSEFSFRSALDGEVASGGMGAGACTVCVSVVGVSMLSTAEREAQVCCPRWSAPPSPRSATDDVIGSRDLLSSSPTLELFSAFCEGTSLSSSSFLASGSWVGFFSTELAATTSQAHTELDNTIHPRLRSFLRQHNCFLAVEFLLRAKTKRTTCLLSHLRRRLCTLQEIYALDYSTTVKDQLGNCRLPWSKQKPNSTRKQKLILEFSIQNFRFTILNVRHTVQ